MELTDIVTMDEAAELLGIRVWRLHEAVEADRLEA